jgi:ABC-type sugar transport system ATPase subunit
MTENGTTLLSVEGATKVFPGVRALDDVSMEVAGGEVLGLVGENGAGKSTLLNILSGRLAPDSGRVVLDGETQSFSRPADALKAGIEIVPQEVVVIPKLSIVENVCLQSYSGSLTRRVRWSKVRREAEEAVRHVRLDVPMDAVAGELPLADQRLVMLARALYRGSRIVIMDEPTVGLTNTEIERVLTVVQELRTHGVALIYCSHQLEEVERLADRVVVLRDGRLAGAFEKSEIARHALVSTIVGHDLPELPEKQLKARKPTLLSVRGLASEKVGGVSFDLGEGEILGLAGLVGSGRTEIVRAIAGADGRLAGEMTLDGAPFNPPNPRVAVGAGVVLVPEDRRRQGLVPDFSARENATLGVAQRYSSGPVLRQKRERAAIEPELRRWRVRPPNPEIQVKNLSGGNQQKIVLMRALLADARVILLDEPTNGVDVGARSELHELIRELAAGGRGLIVVSSDFEEVAMLADRALVVRGGQVVAELEGTDCEPGRMLEECYRDEEVGVG